MNVYERIRKRISENTKLKVKRQMQKETTANIVGKIFIVTGLIAALHFILSTFSDPEGNYTYEILVNKALVTVEVNDDLNRNLSYLIEKKSIWYHEGQLITKEYPFDDEPNNCYLVEEAKLIKKPDSFLIIFIVYPLLIAVVLGIIYHLFFGEEED
jgi:hypothetical protein